MINQKDFKMSFKNGKNGFSERAVYEIFILALCWLRRSIIVAFSRVFLKKF